MLSAENNHIFIYQGLHSQTFPMPKNNNMYDFFSTDNVYKFMQYTREITPRVMVFNLGDDNDLSPNEINDLKQNIDSQKYPIIVTKTHNRKFKLNPQIAHYIQLPLQMRELHDIIESYTIGLKQHHVLLLERYAEQPSDFQQRLTASGYSVFSVHNLDAADIYLRNNHPQIVCVEYNLPFINAKQWLNHERVFYVDRKQDISEIRRFLI